MNEPQRPTSCPLRRLRIAGAWVCFGLAVLGAILPGLPTTIFLILGCSLSFKSHPELAQRVMSWRIFRPLRPYVLDRCPIPPRMRYSAMVMMWIAISLSVISMLSSESVHIVISLLPVALGIWGTIVLYRFRRGPALGEN